MVDKVIVSNKSALQTKYGSTGLSALQAALQSLIAADHTRGLTTQCVWVDDPKQMKAMGGTPPVNASDQRGNKIAVDDIVSKLSPDYIVLLDGPGWSRRHASYRPR
jgi:hypothetical protein